MDYQQIQDAQAKLGNWMWTASDVEVQWLQKFLSFGSLAEALAAEFIGHGDYVNQLEAAQEKATTLLETLTDYTAKVNEIAQRAESISQRLSPVNEFIDKTNETLTNVSNSLSEVDSSLGSVKSAESSVTKVCETLTTSANAYDASLHELELKTSTAIDSIESFSQKHEMAVSSFINKEEIFSQRMKEVTEKVQQANTFVGELESTVALSIDNWTNVSTHAATSGISLDVRTQALDSVLSKFTSMEQLMQDLITATYKASSLLSQAFTLQDYFNQRDNQYVEQCRVFENSLNLIKETLLSMQERSIERTRELLNSLDLVMKENSTYHAKAHQLQVAEVAIQGINSLTKVNDSVVNNKRYGDEVYEREHKFKL